MSGKWPHEELLGEAVWSVGFMRHVTKRLGQSDLTASIYAASRWADGQEHQQATKRKDDHTGRCSLRSNTSTSNNKKHKAAATIGKWDSVHPFG